MSTNNFEDVGDFHRKFDLHASDEAPGPTGAENDDELMYFRIRFLYEELEEFERAWARGRPDHTEMLDALVDLVYVAMGTAHLLGYPWEQAWDAVQAANMRKVRAQSDGSDSKRGSSFDVVKPEGWKPPSHDYLLRRYGFEV